MPSRQQIKMCRHGLFFVLEERPHGLKPIRRSSPFHEQIQSFWGRTGRLIRTGTSLGAGAAFDNPPFRDWFVGGETNLCHNAVGPPPERAPTKTR